MSGVFRRPYHLPPRRRRFIPSKAAGPQTVVLGNVTETWTVNAITANKDLPLGLITQSETVQTLGTPIKTVNLGNVTETGTVNALTGIKTFTLGNITETHTLQTLTIAKMVVLGLVSQSETPQQILWSGPAVPPSIPTLTVEMAFGNDYQDASPTWTDVTTYVRGFQTKAGRSFEMDLVKAGKATIWLDNDDRRFEPLYTSGAYSPNVKPMVPVRIRAAYSGTTYEVWRGFVSSWPQQYREGGGVDSIVKADCIDAFAVLARHETATLQVAEATGTRIGNLLDEVSWPAGNRDIDTGSITAQLIAPDCVDVLDEIQRTVETESLVDALFFIDGQGRAVFQDDTHRAGLGSSFTIGDSGGEVPYLNIEFGYDDTHIWNEVNITAEGGTEQTASDAASQIAYGKRSLGKTGLLFTTDGAALTAATAIRDRYKDPLFRVKTVVIEPKSNPPVAWPAILGATISDRVTVKRNPPGGGTAISQDCYIEAVSHRAKKKDDWKVVLNLSPV